MPYFARTLGLVGLVIGFGSPVFSASPVLAATPVTRAFLANLVPNVDFLDRSSRFALINSKNARLRAFALSEAREQTRDADALYDWVLADAHPMTASAAAAAPIKDLDETPTGSTKPGWPSLATLDIKRDDRVARGQEDLDSLEGLEGKDFDAQYKETQRDALEQVETDYRDYLVNGDNAALLALAKRELPKISKRRTVLGKI